MIYPIGIANLVSAFIGISTLSVARFLDTRDTLHVLEAVLDTQFWLSTHVISVTAGYAVTFLAGFIGICALVHRMATSYDSYPPGLRPKQSEEFQQILYRMIYGIVCFAIFFSFIGTVLGGLWADDSWGRFWGWDPKENGAMMIVLWNAILLHARWDKQVGPRGFAVLAVLGNIVTAWSWFGTNQLGIGLHSYGFTSGALYTLVGFVSANLLFVIVSLMVTRAVAAGSKNVKA
jgi:ABC-type transport system involved in cytochrome c biogenesis permease subunit